MRRPIWLGLTGTAVLGVLLAGCTAGSDPESPSSQEAKASAPADTVEPAGPTDTAAESDLVNARGAASWLSGFTCSPDDAGVWNATGQVTNPGDTPATVRVTASVVDGASHSVQGSGAFVHDVEPQGTVDVTITGIYTDADGRTDLDCVSRVMAGDLTG